jgi:hypothetical protein
MGIDENLGAPLRCDYCKGEEFKVIPTVPNGTEPRWFIACPRCLRLFQLIWSGCIEFVRTMRPEELDASVNAIGSKS